MWTELLHCRARQIIHNPRYAGAFVFGRTKNRRLPNGKYSSRQVPSEEWILLRDMHPGYISWEEHLSNLERVKSNGLAWIDCGAMGLDFDAVVMLMIDVV